MFIGFASRDGLSINPPLIKNGEGLFCSGIPLNYQYHQMLKK